MYPKARNPVNSTPSWGKAIILPEENKVRSWFILLIHFPNVLFYVSYSNIGKNFKIAFF
jgi:hypothetical protein